MDIKGGARLFGFCLVLCLVAFFISGGFEGAGFPYRDLRCIGYLAQGTLYSGQPECVQPPITYFVAAFFSLFGGENLQFLMLNLIVLLNGLCLYTILKIIKRPDPWIVISIALIYCLAILPVTHAQPETIIAGFFFLSGLYILSEGAENQTTLLASALFGLALLTKITSLSGILAAYMIVFHRNILGVVSLEGGAVRFNPKRILPLLNETVSFLLPLCLIFAAGVLIFPNLISYTILSHAYTENLSHTEAIVKIIGFNPLEDFNHLLFIFLLSGGILYLFKSRDSFGLSYIVALLTTYISRVKPTGSTPDLLGSHYVIFPLFFMLIILGRGLYGIRIEKRRMLVILTIFFVLFVGPFKVYGDQTIRTHISRYIGGYWVLWDETLKIRDLIDGFYALLPENQGPVLVNYEVYDILSRTEHKIDMSQVENRNNPPELSKYLDPAFVPGLKFYGMTNQSTFGLYPEEVELAKRLSNREFGMILVGPKAWDSMIAYAMGNVSKEGTAGYCKVMIPAFSHIKTVRHTTTVVLNESDKCRKFAVDIIDYANRIYPTVCGMDQWAANYLIRTILSQNGVRGSDGALTVMDVGYICPQKANLIEKLNRSEQNELRMPVFAIYLTVSLLILVFWKKEDKDNKVRSPDLKRKGSSNIKGKGSSKKRGKR